MILKGTDLKGLSSPNNSHKTVEVLDISTKGQCVWVVNPNTFTDGMDLVVGTIAGNADAKIYAPKGCGLLLRTGFMTLTTDATVANRYVMIDVYQGTLLIGRAYMSASAIAASGQANINIAPAAQLTNGCINATVVQPINGDKGEYYKIWVSAGVAGDSLLFRIQPMAVVLGE